MGEIQVGRRAVILALYNFGVINFVALVVILCSIY